MSRIVCERSRPARYYVAPCDNGGTIDSGRERTWSVVDRLTGRHVGDHDTRDQARSDARARNVAARRLASAE